MSWWLTSRRLPLTLVVTLLTWLVIATVGGSAVPVPQFGGAGRAAVPLALLVSVLPAVAVAAGRARAIGLEAVAVRPVGRADALVLLLVPVSAAAVGLAVHLLLADPAAARISAQALRNLVLHLGLAACARPLLGRQAAVLAPVLYAFVSAAFGLGPGGHPHRWAWPAAGPADPVALAGAVAVLAAGLLVELRQDRPRRHPVA
ncbi:hypothetical protein ACIRBX_29075 [Kitasatospora sp. NPDC096147]|uniref:hypothetical protein n=1 Tax=Kitasatospora sp. NPDC096147 TaxID=3364093 RepID=UPI00382DC3AF